MTDDPHFRAMDDLAKLLPGVDADTARKVLALRSQIRSHRQAVPEMKTVVARAIERSMADLKKLLG